MWCVLGRSQGVGYAREMRPLVRLSLCAGAAHVLGASPAFAHIDLLEPEPRAHGIAATGDRGENDGSNQKRGPCGQLMNGRTTRVTTYAPGETFTLRVREETPHESYIRVVLDVDGDDGFIERSETRIAPETGEQAQAAEDALGNEHLLAVYREFNDTSNAVLEIPVTLPLVTCESCTLQVTQLMFNSTRPYYYQCADLVIAGEPVAAPVADAGGLSVAPDAGPASDGAAGGCHVARGAAPQHAGWGVVAMTALGLATRVRRRRAGTARRENPRRSGSQI